MKSLIFSLLLSMMSWAGPLKVGVMPFTNNSLSDKQTLEPLSLGLADMMASELAKINALTLVERSQLNKVLRETALSMAGITDESAAEKAGRLAGADLLLLGSFTKGFDNDIRIDARLVNVETGATVAAGDATGRPKKVFKVVKKLAFKMAEGLKLNLSGDEKDAIDESGNEDFDALIAYSEGLAAEARGDTVTARASYAKALSLNSRYPEAVQAQKRLTSPIP